MLSASFGLYEWSKSKCRLTNRKKRKWRIVNQNQTRTPLGAVLCWPHSCIWAKVPNPNMCPTRRLVFWVKSMTLVRIDGGLLTIRGVGTTFYASRFLGTLSEKCCLGLKNGSWFIVMNPAWMVVEVNHRIVKLTFVVTFTTSLGFEWRCWKTGTRDYFTISAEALKII